MRNLFTFCLLATLALAGCRGTISDAPPIHINPNMDAQEKFEAQEANPFFADHRAMRPVVPGTVARGFLREDAAFFNGRDASGAYVARMPVPLTRRELLERGRERYNIYCAVCHGKAGDGQGIIMTGAYGYVPAPTYHSDALRAAPDGYLYDVITNGVRNMPGYGHQLAVADRWYIVAYIRALQRSQDAMEGDIPASVLSDLQRNTAASN